AVPTGQRRLFGRAQSAVERRDEEILAVNRDVGGRRSRVDDQLRQRIASELECPRAQPQSGHRAETVHLDADRFVATRHPCGYGSAVLIQRLQQVALRDDASNQRVGETAHGDLFQLWSGPSSSPRARSSAVASSSSVARFRPRTTSWLTLRSRSSRRRATCWRIADNWHSDKISCAKSSGARDIAAAAIFNWVGSPRSVVMTAISAERDTTGRCVTGSPRRSVGCSLTWFSSPDVSPTITFAGGGQDIPIADWSVWVPAEGRRLLLRAGYPYRRGPARVGN